MDGNTLIPLDDIQTVPGLPKRIKAMYQLHGQVVGETCKRCQHLIAVQYGKKYLKCDQSTMTHGAATDWRAGWPACGLFVEATKRDVYLMPK
jgi:hypothetical protein